MTLSDLLLQRQKQRFPSKAFYQNYGPSAQKESRLDLRRLSFFDAFLYASFASTPALCTSIAA